MDQKSDDEDLTQPLNSQQTYNVTPDNERIWARLNSKRKNLPSLELRKDTYTFGRSPDCDYYFRPEDFDKNVWMLFSKIHFRIYLHKENTDECSAAQCVYLEDTSCNGTYVEDKLIKQERVQLNNKYTITTRCNNQTTRPILFVFEDFMDYPVSILKQYSIDRLLGSGSFGKVFLIVCKNTGLKLAMKKISKKYSSALQNSKFSRHRILNEARILTSLNHSNIIKMKNIIDTNNAVFIILECMEGGELNDRIKKNHHLSEDLTKFYFLQIFSAVEYLHSNNIIHRDLKPENILMATSDEHTLVKITDFGLSKIINDKSVMNTICGTPNYQAPEIFFARNQHNASYRSSVDIWSLGVILYYCVSGTLPFQSNKHVSDFNMITNEKIDFSLQCMDKLSSQLKNLIQEMLKSDPKLRPSSKILLEHEWVTSDVELVSEVSQLQSLFCSSDEEDVSLSPPFKKLRFSSEN